MMQNYFVVNGEKYYTGTIFIVNQMGERTEASFICYDTERLRYIYQVKACRYYVDQKSFQRNFISVTDKIDVNVHMPVNKTFKDTEIDGLFLGWLWYIFIMAISTIFYDRIGLWILTSVVFFNWRKKKIEEEGTYVEW